MQLSRRVFTGMVLAGLFLLPGSQLWAASYSGQVVDAMTNEVLPGAQIRDAQDKRVTSDATGTFQLETDDPKVTVRMPGYLEKHVTLKPEGTAIALDSSNIYEMKAVVVKAKPDAKKVVVSKQQMKKESVKKVTTTLFPDVAKVVQMLPGVTTSSDFSSLLYVRGGDPDEVIASLDDMIILRPYIWGGSISVFNPNLVDEVEFYTGGFPAEWPQAMSAILNVKNKVGNTEKIKGFVDLSATTFDLFLDGPLGLSDGSSFLLGLRRTYYDLIIPLFTEDNSVYPYFYDGQMKLSFPTSQGMITINSIYSIEGMDFKIKEEEGYGTADSKEMDFHYLDRKINFSASYDHNFSDTVSMLTLAGIFYQDGSYKMVDASNPFDVNQTQGIAQVRHAWKILLGDHNIFKTGLFLFPAWGKATVHTTSTSYYQRPDLTWEKVVKEENLERKYDQLYYSGFFVQDDMEIIEDLLYINPSVNFQYWNQNKQWVSDPRISLKVKTTPDWEMYLSTGKFSQYPLDTYMLDKETGNPDLKAENAIHYILGSKMDIGEDFFVQLETYYKDYREMINSDPVEHFDNNEVGHAYGFDMILQKKLGGNWDGWLTYSYVKSQRKIEQRNKPEGKENESTVPVDTWFTAGSERPHSVNVILNYSFNEKYKLAFTQKYCAGKISTPIEGANYDPYLDMYFPISGDYNSERLPDYMSTDVKFTMPFFNLPGWSAYIQISNLLDNKNVDSYQYKTDYSERRPIYQLPRIFFGGVKFEF